jgi:hypothetical protein
MSCAGVHKKSLRELSNGLKGARTVAISLVLDASWFTSPQKERRSERLLGVGKFEIASVISELMEYPVDVSLKPANCTSVWQNLNLSRLGEILFSSHRRSSCRTCFTCCCSSLAKVLHPCESLIHSSIVMLTNGADSVWCSQEFVAAEWSDKSSEGLTFLIHLLLELIPIRKGDGW